MTTLAARKRLAHRAFKQAREDLADITTKWREATGQEKNRLYTERKKLKTEAEQRKREWHEAVEAEKRARQPRKKRGRGRGQPRLDYPAPTGFEFVLRPKDWSRKSIDPSWKPPRSQRTEIGKYYFHTLGDSDVRPQAIVTIRVNGESDDEARRMLCDYFDTAEARAHFGDVKVMDLTRRSKPGHDGEIDVTISTDHPRVRGFIRQ
jgi:hypothetical protein